MERSEKGNKLAAISALGKPVHACGENRTGRNTGES
jgi:hypothetical protein